MVLRLTTAANPANPANPIVGLCPSPTSTSNGLESTYSYTQTSQGSCTNVDLC